MLVASLPARIVQKVAGRLRFPTLFLVTALLFVTDLIVPDVIPLVDEILLGLGTLLFATWRQRGKTREAGDGVETGGSET